MSYDTLNLEMMCCKRKEGIEFHDWLKSNKLKMVLSEIKDHYKIYY